MNLPTLPTDNLYKFMAISGIILIISSMVIIFVLYNNLNKDQFKLLKEVDVMNIEQGFLRKEKEIREQHISYLKNIKSKEKVVKERIYKLELELIEIEKNIKIKINNIKITHNKTQKLYSHLMFAFLITFFTISSGFYLSFNGFKKWYEKVQKYLDLDIQKNRRESNYESRKNKRILKKRH